MDWDVNQHMLPRLRVAAASPQPTLDLFPARFPLPLHRPRPLRRLRLIPLGAAELQSLSEDATAVMAEELPVGGGPALASDLPLHQMYRARYWQPPAAR